jgi:hypothetical protein
MPRYYSRIENSLTNFYKEKDYNTSLRIHDNLQFNELELSIIEEHLNIIYKALMEVVYKKNKTFYKDFADMTGETAMLVESGYCVYDLRNNYVISNDDISERDWIYESELNEFYKKLIENKKKVMNAITELNVSSGVAMALLYANYSKQCV